MAEFIHAKHKGIEGLAYVSKDALEQMPGWEPATEKDVEAAAKAASPSRSVVKHD